MSSLQETSKTSKRPSLDLELPPDQTTYMVPSHVRYLNQVLMKLAQRDLLRAGYVGVIVEEPPRHGKSELCSHYFPSWYLGTYPDEKVVLSSYEADFAATWGRKTRNTLEVYGQEIFGVTLDQQTRAADRWQLEGYAGGMTTAGVGGAITGRGANVLIVDDPVKNAQEAASATKRENTWEWWQSTARTRLEPGGVILIIMTRWHEDDLAGRLLRQMEEDRFADKFLRIRLPAFAEENDPLHRSPGEPLWPQRYDTADLEQLRQSVGSYVWQALYQQRPAPREGGAFEEEWFKYVVRRDDKYQRLVRYWDFAATEVKRGTDPDWTSGTLLGRTRDGAYHVVDVQRVRATPLAVQRLVKATAAADGRNTKIRIEQERGSAGKHLVDHYGRLLSGYDCRGVLPTGEKTVRAEPLSACCERGDLFLVTGPWNGEFIREFCAFPYGPHDDQVDSTSGAYEFLSRARKRAAGF